MTQLQTGDTKQPSLFTAIALGVSCMIGSGWLFAAYFASQHAGPSSILSWIIGAFLALILALLLAEIATMYKVRGLFSRLMTLSHNRDFGFVVAISNWLGVVMTVPSEASATMQYLSSAKPSLEHFIYHQHQLTPLGILCVCGLIILYSLVNYWGIKTLARVNNLITVVKVVLPILTAIVIIISSFHSQNFTAYHDTFMPYGIGHVFSAIVVSGIFYAFYGFGMVAMFGAELKNPKRNIPIALVTSVGIAFIIYLLLQVAFIGALPTKLIQHGWHQLEFTSPLAQILILLNLNFWAVVLYIDASISPSATATVYLGSASRMLTGMANDRQLPEYFKHINPIYNISHRSLILTIIISMIMIGFFKNWQDIMIVTAVFQLITCVAIPISFTKFRLSKAQTEREFKVGFGKSFSLIIFLLLSFLLTQANILALVVALVVHIILFAIYALGFYKNDFAKIMNAFKSTWSMFVFLGLITLFGYFQHLGVLLKPSVLTLFLIIFSILFFLMVHQKKAK